MTYVWQTFRAFKHNSTTDHFNICDVINLHYKERAQKTFRDAEITLLKSREVYQNNGGQDQITAVPPIFASKFCSLHNYSDIIAAADENGNVSIHKANAVDKVLKITRAHNNAIFDIAWMPGETKILTMCGDHTAKLWDVGEADINLISTFAGHTQSVKTGDFFPDDPATFATGSRDGNILIWDSRSSRKEDDSTFSPDQTITSAAGRAAQHKGAKKYPYTVTSLTFQDRHNLICCGSTDKFIRIWDMRKTHCAWKQSEPKTLLQSRKCGYTDLKLSPERTKLYASSINCNVFCFNLNSNGGEPIAEFKGHSADSFYVKTCISADGAYLVSGSSDKCVYVWKTTGAELEACPRLPLLSLSGHKAEVTGVDICQHRRTTIVSCADDGTIRTWRPSAPLLEQEDPLIVKSQKSNKYTMDMGLASPERAPRLQYDTPPRKAVRTDEARLSSGKRKRQERSPTPSRTHDSKRQVLSPGKMNPEYRSPTWNLPNFVAQGAGPSHSCSRASSKENKDWLTELGRRSADKKSNRAGMMEKNHRSQPGKRSSRKTLLHYYKKSSKGSEDTTQKT